jgi:hypothetical protein
VAPFGVTVWKCRLPLTPGSRNGRLGGRRRASRLLSEATRTARPFNYSTVQDNGEPTFITKEKGRGEKAREGLQCTSISTPFLSPTSRTHMHAPACCSVSLHSTGALAPARISRSSSQEQKAPVRVSRGSFLSAFSTVSSISALNSGRERNFVTVAG